MPTGKIIFFNKKTGFGFIKDNITGEDYYVMEKNLISDVDDNDDVEFELKTVTRGLEAIAVKKIKSG